MEEAGRIRAERRGSIALIRIDHPPVNALSFAVRTALLAAVEAADADPAVDAIVDRKSVV